MWNPDEFIFVADQTPFSSIRFLLIASGIHWLVTWTLENYMKKRSCPFHVRPIQRYNNLIIGLFSFLVFIFINLFAYRDGRFQSWDRLVCHRPRPTGSYALLWYLFYLSKLWEFSDIYLVILNKTPVRSHFRWHHQTTPSVVLLSLRGDVAYEWATIASNTLLHTFMYPHFAGFWNVHSILVILGAFQLIVGLGFSLYALAIGCGGSLFAQLYGLVLYITYTVGYLNEHFHLFSNLWAKKSRN